MPDPVTDLFGEPTHYVHVPGLNDRTPRDRSYGVRKGIADSIGAPEHTDFSVRTFIKAVRVTFHDGTQADLVNTSNAGFRGIEGWFRSETGNFHRSLGEVAEWEVVR